MRIFLKFEKTFIFIIKLIMFTLLILIFFYNFSKDFPQIKTINRTSIILLFTLTVFLYSSIKMYGGFLIGKYQTSDIRNSAILGTLVGDFLTFIVLHIMSASNINYYKFIIENIKIANKFTQLNYTAFLITYLKIKFLPSFLIFILTFLFQIIVIIIFSKFSNFIYFKINRPKNTIIIYENIDELICLVSKIKKNPFKWNIVELIKYNDKNVFEKIKNNEVIFFSNIPKKERSFILKYCYKHNKNIFIYPDVCDVITNCSLSFFVDDITVLSTTEYEMSFEQKFIKRFFDILFSIIALILTSPLVLILAIIIKLYDNGPIIFKQKRLTKNGKEFNLLKLRSMVVGSDSSIAKKNDCRITPIGKFLRKFRIDEIPQFINILKGELSLVGPRPERIEHIEKFEEKLPEFKYRLKVKAGLTGLAQIKGRYTTTPTDKLNLDLFYIQKYSLWLDLKIILLTLIIFLKPESAQGVQTINNETLNFIKNKLSSKKNLK